MNVQDAAYHTVHDYPGGAEALGPRVGKRGTSLSAEVQIRPPREAANDDAASSRPKFGLLDAVKVMQLSGDHRIFFAIASELGYLTVPLPDAAGCAGSCAKSVAAVAEEFAQLMQEVAVDIADERVSDNELARVERCWGELVVAGQQLLKALANINSHDKAARRQGEH
jgi:hypothetical protein